VDLVSSGLGTLANPKIRETFTPSRKQRIFGIEKEPEKQYEVEKERESRISGGKLKLCLKLISI
jgi:hypothetical protein